MKLDDVEEVVARVPTSGYGLDSIMTMALRQKVQSALEVRVPSTLLWIYPLLVVWWSGSSRNYSSRVGDCNPMPRHH
jgi:6-methylsalicylic acid synthase